VKFSEAVNEPSALLPSTGRIASRALTRECDLEDEALEDLTEELLEAERVASMKTGKFWSGQAVQ
jgi:hypothetical protein